jgi:phage-related protein
VVEWRIEYFRESSGRVPVQEFIDRLTGEEQIETMVGIDMLRTHSLSLGRPGVAPLGTVCGNCAYAHVASVAFYILPHTGRTFDLLHAFVKKTRQVPQAEIETATRRMKEYLRR